MKPTQPTLRYFLYARKSSESEDRQVQSIEDQVNRLKLLAADLKIEIKEIITEAKSAKMPDCRPEFTRMQKLPDKEKQAQYQELKKNHQSLQKKLKKLR